MSTTVATSTEIGVRSDPTTMLNEHQSTVVAPAIIVGRSAARCPTRQAASLDIVIRVRTPASVFRASEPAAALQVIQVTRTAVTLSSISANSIAPLMPTTVASQIVNGNVSVVVGCDARPGQREGGGAAAHTDGVAAAESPAPAGPGPAWSRLSRGSSRTSVPKCAYAPRDRCNSSEEDSDSGQDDAVTDHAASVYVRRNFTMSVRVRVLARVALERAVDAVDGAHAPGVPQDGAPCGPLVEGLPTVSSRAAARSAHGGVHPEFSDVAVGDCSDLPWVRSAERQGRPPRC